MPCATDRPQPLVFVEEGGSCPAPLSARTVSGKRTSSLITVLARRLLHSAKEGRMQLAVHYLPVEENEASITSSAGDKKRGVCRGGVGGGRRGGGGGGGGRGA